MMPLQVVCREEECRRETSVISPRGRSWTGGWMPAGTVCQGCCPLSKTLQELKVIHLLLVIVVVLLLELCLEFLFELLFEFLLDEAEGVVKGTWEC